ncbi:hypothetical protein GOV07_05630 [Candidatus Woesearchaeota archaeon]|nr:hypothetical protein [Candidatus Woesearchaeota archaeon]
MALIYLSPQWFVGYDILLEGIFAVITAAVAFLAWQIYRKTRERQVGLLSGAFLLIALSYIAQTVFNGFMIIEATENIPLLQKAAEIMFFKTLGMYLQILFMLLGLAVLFFMTCKSHNKRLLWFLLAITLLPFIFIPNILTIFYLLTTIYLGFILWYFIDNYRQNRQWKTLLIALAFLFLFIAKAHFLIAVNHQFFYVLGHILELVAYCLILANFLLVLRK